jgi:hypothetical protein
MQKQQDEESVLDVEVTKMTEAGHVAARNADDG